MKITDNAPVIARFLKYVSRVDEPNGCHLWTEAVNNRGGYGVFEFEGRTQTAHRVSHKLFKGPIPDGLIVRHFCHVPNPLCVNPAHLALGTHKDNSDDMYAAWRMPTPDAPLTALECEYIRATVDEHGGTAKDAAYGLGGVHRRTVAKGLRLGREAWERAEFATFLGAFLPFLRCAGLPTAEIPAPAIH